MTGRIHCFITLLLAALGLVMGGAHVLELAPKLAYSPQLYEEVTSTLYAYYGIAGAIVQVLAVLVAWGLGVAVHGRPEARTVRMGASALTLSLGLWFVLVQPVNRRWASLGTGSTRAVIDAYAHGRARWEWGHVAAFVAWLLGTTLLIWALACRPVCSSARTLSAR